MQAKTHTEESSGNRIVNTINSNWKFQYAPDIEPDASFTVSGFDDSAWRGIALPHTWGTYESTGKLHPFIRDPSEEESEGEPYWWLGWGTYRKRLIIGNKHKSRKVFAEFDGVQKYSRVYFNGVFVGEHKGGYTSFSVDLTEHVRFGVENVLTVQVSNRQHDPAGIPPMMAGNFNTYGGIYRDVRLVIADRLHLPFQGSADHEGGTYVTTPVVTAEKATARVRTWVRNDYKRNINATLKTTIFDPEGTVVTQFETSHAIPSGWIYEFDQTSQTIQHPRLWSPESPELYGVCTDLYLNGRHVDHYESPLGFRWFCWDYTEKCLYLNGKKVFINGNNRHQEYPWLGDAIPKWMHETDLKDIRFNLNHNFMRTAHYPQDPMVYDLCDRYGLLVCEEVPNIKNISMFSPEVQERNVKEMIRRDRNHPCIIMWSLANESRFGARPEWARAEDPNRIIHFRAAYNFGIGEFEPHNHLQINMENLLRCTVRGWHDGDSGIPATAMTEENNSGQVAGTEEKQHVMARRKDASIRGQIGLNNTVIWLYADHGCNQQYQNSPLAYINPKGCVDAYRIPKYMYYLWQANYAVNPMVFIHSHAWRRSQLGQRTDIVVDSNCDTVELLVNGRSVGKLEPTKQNFHTVTFEGVMIEEGTLTAIGRRGETQVTHSVTVAGAAARLILRSSHNQIESGRGGIAVLRMDIVDAQDIPVNDAKNEINWKISGPGRLIGPNTFTSDAEKSLAPEGTFYITAPLCIPIRSTAETGTVTVTVESPGLEPATIRIESFQLAKRDFPGIIEPAVEDGEMQQGITSTSKAGKVSRKKKGAIKIFFEDLRYTPMSLEEYHSKLDFRIRAENPNLNTASPAYAALLDELAGLLVKGEGILIADDCNFAIKRFNSLLEA